MWFRLYRRLFFRRPGRGLSIANIGRIALSAIAWVALLPVAVLAALLRRS